MRTYVPRYEGVVGLPPRSIAITNTQRARGHCPRRLWFSEIERLSTGTSIPMNYGRAWHACLEEVHRWWMLHDTRYDGDGHVCTGCGGRGDYNGAGPLRGDPCALCDGTGCGPILSFRRALEEMCNSPAALYTREEVTDEVERLERAFEGWLRRYGRAPYKSHRVVAVEIPLARPILHPRNGKPFRPRMWFVREGDSLRLAATGEVSGEIALPTGATIEKKWWPWYQVATLDCVLQHRRTGALYVGEFKSSASPSTLIEGLNVDPQTDGYCWVLEHAVERGFLDNARDGKVKGFVYDVTSSAHQRDPQPLKPTRVQQVDAEGRPLFIEKGERKAEANLVNKGRRKAWILDAEGEPVLRSPGLSRDTRKTIPSWRYRDAVIAAGYDPADYSEEIEDLRTRVDSKLYVRDFGTVGAEPRARYAEEIYAEAARFAGLWRAAATATDMIDLNIAFPRVTVCRLPGGSCPYRGPCLNDGPDARAGYTVAEVQTWEGR